jgi:hypothetical protein
VPKRASDEVLLAGILLARIERWLEQEGVFHRGVWHECGTAMVPGPCALFGSRRSFWRLAASAGWALAARA